ncbi:DGA1 [Malassezia furfur]|nr:DGA1 [Malassezia furfur]
MAVPEPTVDKLEREKKINVITHADKQRPLFKCLFQSLAVFHWILMPSLCLCVFCLLWYVRCSPSTIPPLWFITIPYVIWSLWIDDAPSTGKRRSMWFRRLFLMRLMRNYFPITLERTVPLPADRPYLFGYHPHGIIGLGAVVSFGSEACGIAQKLPGIVPRVLTLASNFNMPLYREYLMLLGFGSVSRESCETLLSQGPGSAILIVVGGAQESLNARPGEMDLTLKNRKGADLVPTIGFGENDIYKQADNHEGSWLYSLQQHVKRLAGFTIPIIEGRGLFHASFGWMPYQRPINVIIGEPVQVTHTKEPTDEEVDAMHERYVQALIKLYEAHKDELLPDRLNELHLE